MVKTRPPLEHWAGYATGNTQCGKIETYSKLKHKLQKTEMTEKTVLTICAAHVNTKLWSSEYTYLGHTRIFHLTPASTSMLLQPLYWLYANNSILNRGMPDTATSPTNTGHHLLGKLIHRRVQSATVPKDHLSIFFLSVSRSLSVSVYLNGRLLSRRTACLAKTLAALFPRDRQASVCRSFWLADKQSVCLLRLPSRLAVFFFQICWLASWLTTSLPFNLSNWQPNLLGLSSKSSAIFSRNRKVFGVNV